MIELVEKGHLTHKDIHDVVLDLLNKLEKEKSPIMKVYNKGYRMLLTTCGIEIANRESRWNHKKYKEKGETIIQVLTVKELALFVEENSDILTQGKSPASVQIVSFKLEELLDEVYIGNYEDIFKDMNGLRGNNKSDYRD